MAEVINDVVDLTPLMEFTHYEGFGKRDLFTSDGLFKTKINNYQLQEAKGDKRLMIVVSLEVIDDATDTGKNTVHNIVVGGVDKNGKAMIKQLGDCLASCGVPDADIQKQLGPAGRVSIGALLTKINFIQMQPIIEVQYDEYEGNAQSAVRNFVVPEVFAKAKAANAHRRPHRKLAASTMAGAPGSVPLPMAPNLGGSAPVGGAQPLNLGGLSAATLVQTPTNGASRVADPLSSLGGGLGNLMRQ